MAGGGGYYRGSRGGGGHNAATAAVQAAEYTASANAFFSDLLRSFNDRDIDDVRRRLGVLQAAIEAEIDGSTDLLFGGSVRKHTYVDGLSDIDVLVCINRSELANSSPTEVLSYFEARLKQRLENLGVTVKRGALAVSVQYANGTEIQLLPAIRTAKGLRIAASSGDGWSNVVRPQAFASALSELNKKHNGVVVRAIKLFKALQTRLPPNNQLTGYHAESLAIEAFRDYQGRKTCKDMLQHLVRETPKLVTKPIKDSTGQAIHVDDYLGSAHSNERQRVANAFQRLSKSLQAAEAAASIESLKKLFDE